VSLVASTGVRHVRHVRANRHGRLRVVFRWSGGDVCSSFRVKATGAGGETAGATLPARPECAMMLPPAPPT
jgi:hypothetical protein